jgi:hypothetical protein
MGIPSKKVEESSRELKRKIREEALDSILAKHGNITTEIVLAEATKTTHPLHDEFEWSDKVAGHRYRLRQAYDLIRATKFVSYLNETAEAPPKPVNAERVRKYLPAFASGGFRARREVLEKPADRELFIEQRLTVLDAWVRSVADVPELEEIRNAVTNAVDHYRNNKN